MGCNTGFMVNQLNSAFSVVLFQAFIPKLLTLFGDMPLLLTLTKKLGDIIPVDTAMHLAGRRLILTAVLTFDQRKKDVYALDLLDALYLEPIGYNKKRTCTQNFAQARQHDEQ